MDFTATFGQHSGVVHAESDFLALPHFGLNEQFGDLPRFKVITRTLPLPVAEITLVDSVLSINPSLPPLR